MKKQEFIIGICSYGNVTDGFVMSLERLHEEKKHKFRVRFRSQDALIGRSRSILASQFLQEDNSDLLIFVDGDILFEPSDVTKIIESVDEEHLIIGGGYLVSSGEFLALRPWDGMPVPDGTIQEIEYISTGFLGISRKALNQIQEKLGLPVLHKGLPRECYPFFESGVDLTGRHDFYVSEDWDFCDKARDAGLKIYWHSGVMVGHLKTALLRYTDAKTQKGV